MEARPSLAETLQRLDALIRERHLDRSQILDPAVLSARTAVPENTIRRLLKRRSAPADSVNERVSARIKVLSTAYLTRTRGRMADLAAEISAQTGISDNWARAVCDGKKTPNIELLHHLVGFFGVEDESFFTAPSDEALNRVLLPELKRLERLDTDPLTALMDRYGVKAAALRHDGSVSREQLERILEGVLRSVVPQEGDAER